MCLELRFPFLEGWWPPWNRWGPSSGLQNLVNSKQIQITSFFWTRQTVFSRCAMWYLQLTAGMFSLLCPKTGSGPPLVFGAHGVSIQPQYICFKRSFTWRFKPKGSPLLFIHLASMIWSFDYKQWNTFVQLLKGKKKSIRSMNPIKSGQSLTRCAVKYKVGVVHFQLLVVFQWV